MKFDVFTSMVKQLMERGHELEDARKMATKQLQRIGYLEEGSTRISKKGEERGQVDWYQRKRERAAKKTGRNASHYSVGIDGKPKRNNLFL